MKKRILFTLSFLSCISLFGQNIQLHVDADATGLNDGTTWANAFTNLEDAIDSINATFLTGIGEIWVAEGTYKPVNQTTPFTLQRNIHIYGGFDGTEFDLEDRDIEAHPTIIDGDINGDDNGNIDVSESTRQDNAYCLFKMDGVYNILDGLIIQGVNGNENQTGVRWFYDGSAIYFNDDATQCEVRRCLIRNNSAIGNIIYHRGGSDFAGSHGAGRFIYNEITNNYSNQSLLRVEARSDASLSNPPQHTTVFQNNLVHGNTVTPQVIGSVTSLIQLIALRAGSFTSSFVYSGAAHFQDISQNTFADNSIPSNNGYIIRHYVNTDQPSSAFPGQYMFITDNIFSQNNGVEVMYWDTVAEDKENTQAVFWRNLIEDAGTVTSANLGSFNPNIFGNIYGESPGFTDPANDDYTIVGCDKPGNDRGGSWIVTSPAATDFYGNPRTVGLSADIGHAEIQDEFTGFTVEQNGDSLIATAGYVPYTWVNLDDPQNPVFYNDDTLNFFLPPSQGDYAVLARNAQGCAARADIFFCTDLQISLSVSGDSVSASITGPGDFVQFLFEGDTIPGFGGPNVLTVPLQGYGLYEATYYSTICNATDRLRFCGDIPNVSITLEGTSLEASVTDAANYEWYKNGDVIPGETSSTLDVSAEMEADYYVIVSENSCLGTSNTINPVVGIEDNLAGEFKMFPNPAKSTVNLLGLPANSVVNIYSITGQVVATYQFTQSNETLTLSAMSSGVYVLEVNGNGKLLSKRLIVE